MRSRENAALRAESATYRVGIELHENRLYREIQQRMVRTRLNALVFRRFRRGTTPIECPPRRRRRPGARISRGAALVYDDVGAHDFAEEPLGLFGAEDVDFTDFGEMWA